MLTDRGQYTDAVEKALTEKWADHGLTVEQVSVQDVRYPDEITSRYATAQAAEIDKQTAINKQECLSATFIMTRTALRRKSLNSTISTL